MDNFKISKKAQITDEFKCAKYWPDLKPIPYRLCIGRQITKLASGGMQYPDCVECNAGRKITKHFNGYQTPIIKGNHSKSGNSYAKKRPKKGASPYSSHYIKKSQVSPGAPALKLKTEKSCGDNIGMIGGRISEPEINCDTCRPLLDLKTLVNAQVELTIDLLADGKLAGAIQRLGLILEEI